MAWKVDHLQHIEKVKVIKFKLKVNAEMAKSQVALICMKLSTKAILNQHLVVQGHIAEEMLRKQNMSCIY